MKIDEEQNRLRRRSNIGSIVVLGGIVLLGASFVTALYNGDNRKYDILWEGLGLAGLVSLYGGVAFIDEVEQKIYSLKKAGDEIK